MDDYNLAPSDEELHEMRAAQEDLSFDQQLRVRYQELLRDKRSTKDLDCPAWDNGCHCTDMIVGHAAKQGRPWCPACQTAHEAPGHPVVSQDQFLRRFRREMV